MVFISFGRTGLRKGVSEAKFDAEADFDVKKSLAPPKSAENLKKTKKRKLEKIGVLSIKFRIFRQVFEELGTF